MNYKILMLATLTSRLLAMQEANLIRPVTSPKETIERIGRISLKEKPYLLALPKPLQQRLVQLLTRNVYRELFQAAHQPVVRYTIDATCSVEFHDKHVVVQIMPCARDGVLAIISAIYDFQDLNSIYRFELPENSSRETVFSADGTEALCIVNDEVFHYKLINRNRVNLLSIFGNNIDYLDITPKALYAVTVSSKDKTVIRWDLRDQSRTAQCVILIIGEMPRRAYMSSDGQWVLIITDCSVIRSDLRNPGDTKQLTLVRFDKAHSMCANLSSNGQRVVHYSNNETAKLLILTESAIIDTIDLEEQIEIYNPDIELYNPDDSDLSFNDGNWAFYASTQRTWNLQPINRAVLWSFGDLRNIKRRDVWDYKPGQITSNGRWMYHCARSLNGQWQLVIWDASDRDQIVRSVFDLNDLRSDDVITKLSLSNDAKLAFITYCALRHHTNHLAIPSTKVWELFSSDELPVETVLETIEQERTDERGMKTVHAVFLKTTFLSN